MYQINSWKRVITAHPVGLFSPKFYIKWPKFDVTNLCEGAATYKVSRKSIHWILSYIFQKNFVTGARTPSWNKWVNPIFSSRNLFFSIKLLPNIPVFNLNNCFVFHRTWAVNIQSRLKILLLHIWFSGK